MSAADAITPFQENDRTIVMDSWMRSFRNSRSMKSLSDAQYYYLQRLACDDLLERGTVVCARSERWPGGAIGWACGELRNSRPGVPELVVHYAYVKSAYRRSGVCNELLDALGLRLGQLGPGAFTHDKRPYGTMFRKSGWRFEPRYLKGDR